MFGCKVSTVFTDLLEQHCVGLVTVLVCVSGFYLLSVGMLHLISWEIENISSVGTD
jgi:hypothetical protein